MVKHNPFDSWGVRDDKRLALKPLSLRLPIHVQARLFALEELHDTKSRNDLLIDLIKVGLDAYEEAAELTYNFHHGVDSAGKEISVKEPTGKRTEFQELANKHYKKLEKERGTTKPSNLYDIRSVEI